MHTKVIKRVGVFFFPFTTTGRGWHYLTPTKTTQSRKNFYSKTATPTAGYHSNTVTLENKAKGKTPGRGEAKFPRGSRTFSLHRCQEPQVPVSTAGCPQTPWSLSKERRTAGERVSRCHRLLATRVLLPPLGAATRIEGTGRRSGNTAVLSPQPQR